MCLSLYLKKLRWLFKKTQIQRAAWAQTWHLRRVAAGQQAVLFSFLFLQTEKESRTGHLQSRLYENEQWGSQHHPRTWYTGTMSKVEMCKNRQAREHSSRLTYFYCGAPGLSTLVTARSNKWHQGTAAPPLPCEHSYSAWSDGFALSLGRLLPQQNAIKLCVNCLTTWLDTFKILKINISNYNKFLKSVQGRGKIYTWPIIHQLLC